MLIKRDVSIQGTQQIHRFPNNYGASIACNMITRYSPELAVIKFHSEDNDDWTLCYTTPITKDVIPYVTEEEIQELLAKIEAL